MLTNLLETLDRYFIRLDEYLNPMLLRELRQGMRSKVFLGVFLVLQAVMLFSMLIAVIHSISPGDSSALAMANFFFWFTVIAPLLFTLPLKGSVAISGEAKSGTLELLFLTRLSAWRTVGGKWSAIQSQALLVIVALLPYTFMRFYLGSTDLFQELGLLLFCLLLCGLVTALLIAMSAFQGGIVKGSILLACLSWAVFILFSQQSVRETIWDTIFGPAQGIWAALAVWFLMVLFCLQVGAARIAPPAENHTLRKRAMGLVFLLAMPGFISVFDAPYWLSVTVGLAMAFPLILESLMEPIVPLRSLYHNDRLHPMLSGIVRYFFSPGWCSGVFYTLLCCVVASVWLLLPLLWENEHVLGKPQMWFLLLNGSALLILPTAITGIFRRNARCNPAVYLLVTLVLLVLMVLSTVLSITAGQDFHHILACLPHGQLFSLPLLAIPEGPPIAEYSNLTYLTIAASVTGVAWIIAIGRALQQFLAIANGEIEQAPIQDPNEPEPLPSMV